MPYNCDQPHFTLTVHSGFISDWQWAVHAVVKFRSLGLTGMRREIEARARLELMIGISKESRLGRERGARTVLVLVEGDREVAGFFNGLERSKTEPRVAPVLDAGARDPVEPALGR